MPQEDHPKPAANRMLQWFAGFIVAWLVVRLAVGLPVIFALPLLETPGGGAALGGVLVGAGALCAAACFAAGRAFGRHSGVADAFGLGLATGPLLDALSQLLSLRSTFWVGTVVLVAFDVCAAAAFFLGFRQGRRELARARDNATDAA